jgi:hypothetical protein
VHICSGEQAFEDPSIKIMHDKIFRERVGATARLRSSSSSLIYILFRLSDFDHHHGDNYSVVAVSAFPVALYVLLISYLALVLVPLRDPLDVLA